MILTQSLGDTVTHRIPLRWGNKAFVPGSEWGLLLTVKSDPATQDDEHSLFQKTSTPGEGITVSGSTAMVQVLRVDTVRVDSVDPPVEAFEAAPGTYYWDVQATRLSDGYVQTVAEGTMVLKRDVTRNAEPTGPIFVVETPVFSSGVVTTAVISENEPANLTEGMLWYSPLAGSLSFRYGESWIDPVTSMSLSWNDVTNKPATFRPSTHTHAFGDLTGVAAATHYHNATQDLLSPLSSATPDTLDQFLFGDVSATAGDKTPIRFATITALKALLKAYFDTLYWKLPEGDFPLDAYYYTEGDGYYHTPGDYYTAPAP